jgi:uncharacterized protein (TIGR03089 family)
MRDLSGQTAASLLGHATAPDPAQPMLTWYDDGTGERVELSGLTLANWVAKTANLLVDGCGLGAGDTATVLLAPHWQTAAVLLGCWTAGLSIGSDGAVVFATSQAADAGDSATLRGPGLPVESAAADRFLLGLAPMGLPMRGPVPPGWLDYIGEVRQHGDHFTPAAPVRPGQPALAGETHAALVARAAGRAGELGIPAGGRVLLDAGRTADPVDWLLAPLAAGASIVLCKDLAETARAGRAAAERAVLLSAAGD